MVRRLRALSGALALAFLTLSAATPVAAAPGDTCGAPGTVRSALWSASAIETTVARDMAEELSRSRIPGGVLVVVHEGRTIYAKGFGAADLARRTPVSPDWTLFSIGSISKTMTALALLDQLERHGKGPDAAVADLAGLPALRRAGGVTVAQLLAHTAGFEEAGPAFYHAAPFLVPPSARDHLARTMPALVYPPGTRRAYSNYGYAVAGEAAARLAGVSYPALLRQSLFAPLGMRSASAVQPLPSDLAGRMATGYAADPGADGAPRAVPSEFARAPGAGEVTASGADMARYMAALLDPGGQGGGAVRPAVIADAFARHWAEASCANAIGRAFWIEHRHGQRLVRHSGESFGFVANMLLFPEHQLGVFYAFNRSDFAAMNRLEDRLIDRWFALEQAPAALSAESTEARRIAGAYLGTRVAFTHVAAVARLFGDGLAELGVAEDGALRYRGERWHLRGPGLWEAEHGGRLLATYTEAGRDAFVQGGAQSFRRAALLDLPEVWLAVLGALLLVLAVSAPLLVLRGRGSAGLAWTTARLAPAALLGVFMAGVALFATGGFDQADWAFGPPLTTQAALALFSTAPAIALIVALQKQEGIPQGQGRIAALALAAGAGTALWLWHWHLAGLAL